MLDATIVAFVENVSGERIRLRIAEPGRQFRSCQNISLEQGTMLRDDADNWQFCPSLP